MGAKSDQLHHKAKHKKSLSRRKLPAKPLKALILTEGTCTEPHYLRELIQYLGVPKGAVSIKGVGASPLKVIEEGVKAAVSPGVERLFFVVDRDNHGDLERAKTVLKRNSDRYSKTAFHLIISDPCFEFWYLMHYKYTTKDFGAADRSNRAKGVIKELRKCWPDYKKNDQDHFQHLFEQLPQAIQNLQKLPKDHCCFTEMPILINQLEGLGLTTKC